MWIEIRDFDIFGKKTLRRIHGIKNSEFVSRFVEILSNE